MTGPRAARSALIAEVKRQDTATKEHNRRSLMPLSEVAEALTIDVPALRHHVRRGHLQVEMHPDHPYPWAARLEHVIAFTRYLQAQPRSRYAREGKKRA